MRSLVLGYFQAAIGSVMAVNYFEGEAYVFEMMQICPCFFTTSDVEKETSSDRLSAWVFDKPFWKVRRKRSSEFSQCNQNNDPSCQTFCHFAAPAPVRCRCNHLKMDHLIARNKRPVTELTDASSIKDMGEEKI